MKKAIFLALTILGLAPSAFSQQKLSRSVVKKFDQLLAGESEIDGPLGASYQSYDLCLDDLDKTLEEEEADGILGTKEHEMDYTFEARTAEEVYSEMVNAQPAELWRGKATFYNGIPANQSAPPSDGIFPSREEGDILFVGLNIRFASVVRILGIAVGFRVVKVDPEQKVIEFSYLNSNTSKGVQRIEISDTTNGGAYVFHKSCYRSKNGEKYRDDAYPYFHEKMINDFYRNLEKRLAARDS